MDDRDIFSIVFCVMVIYLIISEIVGGHYIWAIFLYLFIGIAIQFTAIVIHKEKGKLRDIADVVIWLPIVIKSLIRKRGK